VNVIRKDANWEEMKNRLRVAQIHPIIYNLPESVKRPFELNGKNHNYLIIHKYCRY
jgi:hypothetical protein